MKTSIVRNDFWYDPDFTLLHLDSKYLYTFLLSSPFRDYLNVYPWNKRLVASYVGFSEEQLDIAVKDLTKRKLIDIYDNYIGVLKPHLVKIGGPYGAINANKELQMIPDKVREHFQILLEGKNDLRPIERPKEKRPGPAPETVKQIISKQPESLRQSLQDFVDDRKERKRPATTRAVKGWIIKLERMYPNDIQKQVESIDQSIERGWNGLFEVKGEDKKQDGAFM